jgi:molecular chaperone DnaK (HSP70)
MSKKALTEVDRGMTTGWKASYINSTGAGSVVSLKSSSSLVIGIDFGTTYTGVAYAHSASIGAEQIRINSETRNELDAIVEKISVIKTWPNSSQQYAEKTPSLIAYEGGKPIAWGGQVTPQHEIRIAGFKLGLHAAARSHYVNASASRLGGFLNTPNWRHESLPSKSAEDYTADYLALVGNHVVNKALRERFDEQYLKNQHISFVLTVPAIWSDKEKDATRRAAQRAGIPLASLTLITDPEAAAHFCATACNEVNLKIGEHFLVCDAGGGTVVRSLFSPESDNRISSRTESDPWIRFSLMKVRWEQELLVGQCTLMTDLSDLFEQDLDFAPLRS